MALNGADTIALTKLDVLTRIGPIKVCVAYEYEGKRLDRFPGCAGATWSVRIRVPSRPAFGSFDARSR